MGLFSNAKENYDRRHDIAEYNFKAREYISEGQQMYEDAYYDLQIACIEVGMKVKDFFSYKKKILDEINLSLKKTGTEIEETHLTTTFEFPEINASAVSQEEKIYAFEKIIDTWTLPSITDLFGGASSEDYYEAKAAMQQAKAYKMQLKTKREELKNAKYAVKSIPGFISSEKTQIEELMRKFRNISSDIEKLKDKRNVENLISIANIIADTLKTEFVDNNYQVTSQYNDVHNRIESINNSIN